jgi:hypothetical protein
VIDAALPALRAGREAFRGDGSLRMVGAAEDSAA